MSDSLMNGGVFLVRTLFEFYLMIMMICVLLRMSKANYFNPLIQMLVKLTDPLLKPVRRVIPSVLGFDLPGFFVLFVLKLIELYLLLLITDVKPVFVALVVWAVAAILKLLVNVYFFAIIVQALMSWFSPNPSPLSHVLFQLTEPLLSRVRRFMPNMNGVDITPIPVMIILQLINIVFLNYLLALGMHMLA